MPPNKLGAAFSFMMTINYQKNTNPDQQKSDRYSSIAFSII
jgi:hypothetical protein